jgi:hypothetical protein
MNTTVNRVNPNGKTRFFLFYTALFKSVWLETKIRQVVDATCRTNENACDWLITQGCHSPIMHPILFTNLKATITDN